jgi:hypothetical protein
VNPFGLRARAWLALAAFVCSFALPLAATRHSLQADDVACNLTAASAGAEATLRDAPAGSDEDHCPLCHFQRAVGGASASRAVRISITSGSSMSVPASFRHAQAPVLGTRSSRAPPTLL